MWVVCLSGCCTIATERCIFILACITQSKPCDLLFLSLSLCCASLWTWLKFASTRAVYKNDYLHIYVEHQHKQSQSAVLLLMLLCGFLILLCSLLVNGMTYEADETPPTQHTQLPPNMPKCQNANDKNQPRNNAGQQHVSGNENVSPVILLNY